MYICDKQKRAENQLKTCNEHETDIYRYGNWNLHEEVDKIIKSRKSTVVFNMSEKNLLERKARASLCRLIKLNAKRAR